MSRITSGSTVAFFALTYAVAWAFFIPIARSASATMSPVLSLLALIGTFAPAMVALALTARDEGEAGVRALLERTLRWRVAARWYVFAASYFVIIKLSVALIIRLSSGAWPRFGTEPWYLIPAAILISTTPSAAAGCGKFFVRVCLSSRSS